MAEDKQEEGEGAQMSLIGHLTELRNRLSVAFLAFVVLFVITIMPMPGGGFNSNLSQVFMFLQAPLAEILEERVAADDLHRAAEGFHADQVGFFTALCISFRFESRYGNSSRRHSTRTRSRLSCRS